VIFSFLLAAKRPLKSGFGERARPATLLVFGDISARLTHSVFSASQSALAAQGLGVCLTSLDQGRAFAGVASGADGVGEDRQVSVKTVEISSALKRVDELVTGWADWGQFLKSLVTDTLVAPVVKRQR